MWQFWSSLYRLAQQWKLPNDGRWRHRRWRHVTKTFLFPASLHSSCANCSHWSGTQFKISFSPTVDFPLARVNKVRILKLKLKGWTKKKSRMCLHFSRNEQPGAPLLRPSNILFWILFSFNRQCLLGSPVSASFNLVAYHLSTFGQFFKYGLKTVFNSVLPMQILVAGDTRSSTKLFSFYSRVLPWGAEVFILAPHICHLRLIS